MPGERNGIPADGLYLSALGLAVYAFARCEWQVVWCAERIKPGAMNKIVADEMTAGTIAKHFANLVRSMPKSTGREKLGAAAAEFAQLVDERNRIVHGKPCTAPSGAQRLSAGHIIDIKDLEQASDAFAACGNSLNDLYYGFLQSYVPT